MSDQQHIDALWGDLDAVVFNDTIDPIERVRRYYAIAADLRDAIDEARQDDRDRSFGKGHREGRVVGHAEGWNERDTRARGELAAADASANAATGEIKLLRQQIGDLRAEVLAEASIRETTDDATLTKH